MTKNLFERIAEWLYGCPRCSICQGFHPNYIEFNVSTEIPEPPTPQPRRLTR